MGLYVKIWGRALATVVTTGLLVSMSACGLSPQPQPTSSPSPTTGPISVVASTRQWGSLAKQIGGDDVDIVSVAPTTSSDAHGFEPKSSDLAKLRKASVLVSNGAGYDAWAAEGLAKGAQNVSAAEGVGAMDGDNPYLWFSKDARKAMASELTEVFSKERPTKKKAFATRLKQWNTKETALEKAMKTFGAHHRSPTYAATDEVAYYLMSDMGFKDLTPRDYEQSVTSSEEPTSTDLKYFQRLLEQHKVDLLVVGNSSVGTDPTTLVASAKQGEVPALDISEQMPQDVTNLTDWIRSIVNQLSTNMPEDQAVVKTPSDTETPAPSPTESTGVTPADPTPDASRSAQ